MREGSVWKGVAFFCGRDKLKSGLSGILI